MDFNFQLFWSYTYCLQSQTGQYLWEYGIKKLAKWPRVTFIFWTFGVTAFFLGWIYRATSYFNVGLQLGGRLLLSAHIWGHGFLRGFILKSHNIRGHGKHLLPGLRFEWRSQRGHRILNQLDMGPFKIVISKGPHSILAFATSHFPVPHEYLVVPYRYRENQ